MIDAARALEALATVRDPELDEPITDLRFVESLGIDGDSVRVKLRLPTFWCAPNFAYIMAADAKEAVAALEGVGEVTVELIDHMTSAEINRGLDLGASFDETFEGQSTGLGLSELRDLFNRKAFIARQEKLCRAFLDRGLTPEALSDLRLGDLPQGEDTEGYVSRRKDLGLDSSSDAPFPISPAGERIEPSELLDHLRFARTVGVSIEANAGLCRSLLAQRYGMSDPEEATL